MTDTNKDEVVDLNKLTQKELLLQMHRSLEELNKRLDEMKSDSHKDRAENMSQHAIFQEQINDMSVRVSVNETKLKYFAAAAGFIAGAVASAITKLIPIL